MDDEEWRPVVGWIGYEVSSLGRVRSMQRKRHVANRVLKACQRADGYVYYKLYGEYGKKSIKGHRLVARAFLGDEPFEKAQVNHKNGVKSDNRIENLEWVTRSENCLHAYRVLGRPGGHAGLRGAKSPFSRPVERFDLKTGDVLKRYASSVEARREDGYHDGSIRMACAGVYSQHKGFGWRYVA